MHRHFMSVPRVGALALLLLVHATVVSAAPADTVQPIERIVAERVKFALPEGNETKMRVIDDGRIGLFGTANDLPIDAIRQTRSIRDLDVLIRLKLVRFTPRKPVKLTGAAAVAAYLVSSAVSNYVDRRNTSQQPFYYPPLSSENAPIDSADDSQIVTLLAGLVSADGCGARTIALLRRIAAGPGGGQLTAASLDARRLLKRFGNGAYYPTDACSSPEVDADYLKAIAATS